MLIVAGLTTVPRALCRSCPTKRIVQVSFAPLGQMRNRSNALPHPSDADRGARSTIGIPHCGGHALAAKDRLRGMMTHGEAPLQEEASCRRIPIHHFAEGEERWISFERKVRCEFFCADTADG